MNRTYKVLTASNEIPSYAFEEIESKMNHVAKDGFKPLHPIDLYSEDRGDNAQTLYYVVVTMYKKDKKQTEDDSRDEVQARKEAHRKERKKRKDKLQAETNSDPC